MKLLAAIGLIGFAVSLCSAESERQFAQLEESTKALSSPSFSQREEATRRLIELGKVSVPSVAKAASARDVDVRSRALRVLTTLLESTDADTSRIAAQALTTLANSNNAVSANSRAVLMRREQLQLRGLWQVVDGPERQVQLDESTGQLFFIDNVVFSGTDSDLFGPRHSGAVCLLNPCQTPKELDCGLWRCIYLLDRDQLTICAARSVEGPRPKEFPDSESNAKRLLVLKRVPAPSVGVNVQREIGAAIKLRELRADLVIGFQPKWLAQIGPFGGPDGIRLSSGSQGWVRTVYSRHTGVILNKTKNLDEGIRLAARFEQLRRLDLPTRRMTDREMALIGQLTRLEYLGLHYSEVSDEGLRHVEHLSNLRNLRLGYTRIGDAGLIHLGQLRELSELSLIACNRKRTEPAVRV